MHLLELIKDKSFEEVKSIVTQEPYNLVVNEDAEIPLYLLKYHQIDSDMGNPVVQECRGIILEKDTNKVVCYPFNKFFNLQQTHAHTIDWSTAKVLSKEDGSLIKLYFYNGWWKWATNGTIQAKNAPHQLKGSFFHLIGDAVQYAIDERNEKNCIATTDGVSMFDERFNKDMTYMFELTHPLNKIVIRYDNPALYYLGSRNNKTFQEEYNNPVPDLFPEPKTFSFNTLEDALNMSTELPFDQEGYVVVDSKYNRVKLKSPAYFAAHRMLGNGNVTTKRLIEMVRLGKIDDFAGMFPEYNEIVDGLKTDITALKQKLISANFNNLINGSLCFSINASRLKYLK